MKYIVTLSLFFATVVAVAQCPTIESISKSRKKEKDDYAISSQSRTGALLGDQKYEMSFVAQVGLDYRLSTVTAEGAAGSVSYEVYEMNVEKNTEGGKEQYKKQKTVLASSAAGSGPIEFTTDKVRKIFVAVSVAGGDKKKPTCVGVLVETKRSQKTGF